MAGGMDTNRFITDARRNQRIKEQQREAAKIPLPNPELSKIASFNIKDPFKLLKYTPDVGGGQPSFSIEQGGVEFGFGSFQEEYGNASQFDPTKPFEIVGGADTPTLKQGNLSFRIPNPVALGTAPLEKEIETEINPKTVSPNAPSPGEQLPLPRVTPNRTPRNIKTGAIIGTAASRTRSASDVAKNKSVGIRRPMLSGY